MFFSKSPYRGNFRFLTKFDAAAGQLSDAEKSFAVELNHFGQDISQVSVKSDELWGENRSIVPLSPPSPSSTGPLTLGSDGKFQITVGRISIKGRFGVLGSTSMFEFELPEGTQYFGMGEKYFGQQELSGYRAKFWNTDVWSDFHFAQWDGYPSDPPYFSTPYLAVKVKDTYFGLLLHNPSPAFMETPGVDDSRVFVEWQRTSPTLLLGNEGGQPNLYVIAGPTLAEVTQKLQKLVGVTPLPPLWSLGYHQSKWGYGGHDDLLELDRQFEENGIPCDGLWMDLDYMKEFRIFTVDRKAFPEGPQSTASLLAKNGRRIVPIIDPGVKSEKGYAVFDDGSKQDVFCKTSEGKEFIGLVWPGETVFPDFTLERVRNWWSTYTEEFRRSGFGACWVDMNDPSTGPVDPYEMWFNNGKDHHNLHRNQYALGMQKATFEGFLKAQPNERPFILSRSGFIGTSRYAAIWTGDNVSNYFYLKNSIPCAIGMSLSGLPFAGMDIGGFGGDITDNLMMDWMKLAFLFPFTRNHNGKGNRDQEPFSFPSPVMSVVRKYIRLRYKLLPYLYQLFIQQEEKGDPILRPVLYHFDEAGNEKLDDQFMIGKYILQAPFVNEEKTRSVTLPGAFEWFDARTGDWIKSSTIEVRRSKDETPLFVRAGAILPMQPGTPTNAQKEMHKVNFHVFIPDDWTGETREIYKVDDGISYDYQKGIRSAVEVVVVSAKGHVSIDFSELADDFGAIEPTFVVHGNPQSIKLKGQKVTAKAAKATLTGKPLSVSVI
jgi:alpha-glucosidase